MPRNKTKRLYENNQSSCLGYNLSFDVMGIVVVVTVIICLLNVSGAVSVIGFVVSDYIWIGDDNGCYPLTT